MGNCCAGESQDNNTMDIKVKRQGSLLNSKAKKGAKGATSAQVTAEFMDDFTNDTDSNEELLWDDDHEFVGDLKTDRDMFYKDEVTLKRKGKTHPLFKQEVMDRVRTYLSEDVLDKLEETGDFEYRKTDLELIDTDENELVILSSPQASEDMYYIGQFNPTSNTREGRGIAIYTDGSFYVGFWRNDQRHGIGRIIYPSSDIYQGQWKKNACDGYGTFISDLGSKYKGDWRKGQWHGHGFEIDSEGAIYRGEFKNGAKDGQGTLKYPDHTRYDGDFKNNLQHGQGLIQYKDGKSYRGGFKAGKFNGKGKFSWPTGAYYDGDYVDGNKEGKGLYNYGDGQTYNGEWKANSHHGIGIFTHKNGKKSKYEFDYGDVVTKL